MDPAYLRYFESNGDARLSAGSTILLAVALDTTPTALRGQNEWPPGGGRAGPHPELMSLTTEQCEAHIVAGGIGRIVFSTDRGPVALPVNYEYSDDRIIVSTDATKATRLEDQETVGFEIDRIDDVLSEGWSVLITGSAKLIDDPEELVRLSSLDLESWAGGNRHALVAIEPVEITGRVIVHSDRD